MYIGVTSNKQSACHRYVFNLKLGFLPSRTRRLIPKRIKTLINIKNSYLLYIYV